MPKPEIEAALKAAGDEVAAKVRDILVQDLGTLGAELKPILDGITLQTVNAVRDALAGDRKEIGAENLKMLGHQIELCGALSAQEVMQSLRKLAMEVLPVALNILVKVLGSLNWEEIEIQFNQFFDKLDNNIHLSMRMHQIKQLLLALNPPWIMPFKEMTLVIVGGVPFFWNEDEKLYSRNEPTKST